MLLGLAVMMAAALFTLGTVALAVHFGRGIAIVAIGALSVGARYFLRGIDGWLRFRNRAK